MTISAQPLVSDIALAAQIVVAALNHPVESVRPILGQGSVHLVLVARTSAGAVKEFDLTRWAIARSPERVAEIAARARTTLERRVALPDSPDADT